MGAIGLNIKLLLAAHKRNFAADVDGSRFFHTPFAAGAQPALRHRPTLRCNTLPPSPKLTVLSGSKVSLAIPTLSDAIRRRRGSTDVTISMRYTRCLEMPWLIVEALWVRYGRFVPFFDENLFVFGRQRLWI